MASKLKTISSLLLWVCAAFCFFLADTVYAEESQESISIVSEYRNTPPGSPEWTPALVISTAFDTELTKRTDFNASYRCNIVNEESGKYTHHALAALEFELTNRLDLNLSVIWDRIHKPIAEEDGTVPDQDDFYYFCGIEFEL